MVASSSTRFLLVLLLVTIRESPDPGGTRSSPGPPSPHHSCLLSLCVLDVCASHSLLRATQTHTTYDNAACLSHILPPSFAPLPSTTPATVCPSPFPYLPTHSPFIRRAVGHTARCDEPAAGGEVAAAADDDVPSDEEMEGINKIVQDTGVMKLLQDQTKEHQQKLDALHTHINEEIQGEYSSPGGFEYV